MSDKFLCDQCGTCCRNIRRSKFSEGLDRGDGVCKNLDTSTNLCTIYAERPIFCNVDAQEFHKLNHDACRRLKKIHSNN